MQSQTANNTMDSLQESYTNGSSEMNSLDLLCKGMLVGPTIWAALIVPCACVGAPASVWLLWVLIQRQRSGSSNNDVYMLNLTVMDVIYNTFLFPMVLNFFVWKTSFVYAGPILFSLSFCARPLFMTGICADCYLAVVHPISYMKIKDTRYRTVVSVVVWAMYFCYSLTFHFKHNLTLSPLIIMWFVLCIPAIVGFDAAVFHTLRKPDPSGKFNIHPQKQRALRVIRNSLVVTLLSYLPGLLLYATTPLMHLSRQEMFCHILLPASSNAAFDSTIMPLLHLANHGKLTGFRWAGCCKGE